MAERRMFDDILNAFKCGDIDEAESNASASQRSSTGRVSRQATCLRSLRT